MPDLIATIESCIPALRRYACALLRNQQDADDLVHDALVRALDNLATKREDSEVRPWLFTIMHNLFVSQIRKAKVRRHRVPLDDIDEADTAVAGRQDDHMRWREMVEALQHLSEDQRSVLLLVSVESLSYAEVASVLNIPVGTVMSRLARARERLRVMTDGGGKPSLRAVR